MIDFNRTQTRGPGFVYQSSLGSGDGAVVNLNFVNYASHPAIKRLTRTTNDERFTIHITDVEGIRLCPLQHAVHVELYIVAVVGADQMIVLPGFDYGCRDGGGPEINARIRAD